MIAFNGEYLNATVTNWLQKSLGTAFVDFFYIETSEVKLREQIYALTDGIIIQD